MTNIELLDLIRKEYYRIQPKKCSDFFKKRDRRIPCRPNLQKLFEKTYNEILILAGIADDDLNFVRRNRKEYLNKIKEVILKLGYVPSISEFLDLGYNASIIKKYFGSYANAVKELGFDASNCKTQKTPVKVTESKEELLQMYINFSNKIGKPASAEDLAKSDKIYDSGVFIIRFGSMKNLKKEAGFEIIDTNSEIYKKEYVKNRLIHLYNKKGGRLTVKEINADNELPTYRTVLTKFQTTKIGVVWEEIESTMDL